MENQKRTLKITFWDQKLTLGEHFGNQKLLAGDTNYSLLANFKSLKSQIHLVVV